MRRIIFDLLPTLGCAILSVLWVSLFNSAADTVQGFRSYLYLTIITPWVVSVIIWLFLQKRYLLLTAPRRSFLIGMWSTLFFFSIVGALWAGSEELADRSRMSISSEIPYWFYGGLSGDGFGAGLQGVLSYTLHSWIYALCSSIIWLPTVFIISRLSPRS
jgi:hypothetical protein